MTSLPIELEYKDLLTGKHFSERIKVCLFELCTLFSTVCIDLIISWTEWILNKYNILDRMDTKHTSRDCLEIDLK
jgi:hypothetical protein